MKLIDLAFILKDCGGDIEKAQGRIDRQFQAVMDEAEKLAKLIDRYNDPLYCDADETCYSDANELICLTCLSAKALARFTAFKEGNDE